MAFIVLIKPNSNNRQGIKKGSTLPESGVLNSDPKWMNSILEKEFLRDHIKKKSLGFDTELNKKSNKSTEAQLSE